ncbi:jg4740, partial [Pararge aegeria aegeria]
PKAQNSLSKLAWIHRNTYDKEYIFNDNIIDNFIDCGPDIKGETEQTLPLIYIDKELASISDEDMTADIIDEINVIDNKIEIKPLLLKKGKLKKDINKRVSINRKVKKQSTYNKEEDIINKKALENKVEIKALLLKNRKLKNDINKRKVDNQENMILLENEIVIEPLLINRELKNDEMNRRKVKNGEECVKEEGFSRIRMTEEELLDSIEKRKLEEGYVNASNKCKSCVEVFKDEIELEEHNKRLHVQVRTNKPISY